MATLLYRRECVQVHSRGCTMARGGRYRENRMDERQENIRVGRTYGVRFVADKVVDPVTCSRMDETITDPFGRLVTVHKH